MFYLYELQVGSAGCKQKYQTMKYNLGPQEVSPVAVKTIWLMTVSNKSYFLNFCKHVKVVVTCILHSINWGEALIIYFTYCGYVGWVDVICCILKVLMSKWRPNKQSIFILLIYFTIKLNTCTCAKYFAVIIRLV